MIINVQRERKKITLKEGGKKEVKSYYELLIS